MKANCYYISNRSTGEKYGSYLTVTAANVALKYYRLNHPGDVCVIRFNRVIN